MKQIIAWIAAVTLLTAAAPGGEVCHWYMKRNREHRQPVAESQMAFVDQYGGVYVDKSVQESGEKVLYLTFDAGYENGNIARILDILKEKQVPAAFFVLGHLVSAETPLVMRMAQEGHLVCNHTFSHRNMAKATPEEFRAELVRLEQCYREATGLELAKFYRPPEGTFSKCNLETAQQMGYSTVFWSFAYADWDNNKQPSRADAIEKMKTYTHNGAVLLLHPTSKTNADVLGEMIDYWRSEGYTFGTLQTLCERNKAEP